MYYVYILKCSDDSYYVGFTEDLGKRVDTHNSGYGANYTKINKPCCLVYHESFSSKNKALKRELQLKRWSKVKKRALVARDLSKLKQLSKKKFK